MTSRGITPETRISLKASQFWSIVVVIAGAAGVLSNLFVSQVQLRKDHDEEVAERRAADKDMAEALTKHADIMREITREIDRLGRD